MTERYGIDISRAQGAIDWDTLAQNADLSFVLIRAAQGTALRRSRSCRRPACGA